MDTRPKLALPLAFLLASLLAAAASSETLSAQKLRRGIQAADVLVVAICVRVQPTEKVMLHRLKLKQVLRGEELLRASGGDLPEQVTVVVLKGVGEHNRPAPAKLRLYCLHDESRLSRRLKLPAGFGPYFRMSGFPGTNPDLSEPLAKDPYLAFVSILLSADKGLAPRKVADQLYELALRGDTRVRTEALHVLAERNVLQGYLNKIQMNAILSRAIGESDDVAYKVALADLCAVKHVDNLVGSLCVGVPQTGDERFLRALGRIATFLHREKAAAALMPHVQRAKGKNRDRLIYALGATATDGALKALLKMHDGGKDRAAVEAALRVHGAPRALAKIRKQPPTKKQPDGQ